LQQITQLHIKNRIEEINHRPVWLYQSSTWQQFWEGDIIRLRLDELPVKGNRSGNIEDFIFKDDEGIGEQTAFLYHPLTRVLALQVNQSGVSPPVFAKYFEIKSAIDVPIYIDPVIQLCAMEKLDKMQTINKFEIRVASLDNMEVFQNEDRGVKEMIKLSDTFGSPTISFNFSTSRRKQESLSVERVLDAARSWVRQSQLNKQQVKVIRISGSTNEDENLYVDLLNDRMREVVDITSGNRSRTVSYLERQKALRDSWLRRQQELLSMYEPR